MGEPREYLYDLLPAIHRIRDRDVGQPLRALLAVMKEQMDVVETDIDRLYDDWFIETCEEWAVPYIGDLLGVRGLDPIGEGSFSLRAFVANTLLYRQAKGTATVLERLTRDLTGWPAVAVEFFDRIASTQNLNHLRPHARATAHVRDAGQLELLGSPFEGVARTADVRRIRSRRGTHNIPNVGLYVWRFPSYAVTWGEARPDAAAGAGRFTFDPLGRSQRLFNQPRTGTEFAQRADEATVSGPLRRRALYDELGELRAAIARGGTHDGPYFGAAPVVRVRVAGEDPVPSEQLVVCDLADWDLPDASVHDRAAGGTYRTRVVVDPRLGRLGFLDAEEPARVQVSYSYAFGGDLGAGPYDRSARLAGRLPAPVDVTWQRGVVSDPDPDDPDPDDLVTGLEEAIVAWNAHVASLEAGEPDPVGIIALMDSATYGPQAGTAFEPIDVPERGTLLIIAADWPLVSVDDADTGSRFPGRVAPVGRRPHLLGDLIARGVAPAESPRPGRLVLDGLTVEGDLLVTDGLLGGLEIRSTTIVPGRELSIEGPHPRLEIGLERGICGSIVAPDAVIDLRLADSIIDGRPAAAIEAPDAALRADACTLLGEVRVKALEGENTIFRDPVSVERRQAGCVQFSWIAPGSLVPRRFRCVPESESDVNAPAPTFTSLEFGDPGYGSLTAATDRAISEGAKDGGEMGAFHFVHATRRLRNVARNLEEYLRFGLEAGIFTVT